MASKKEQEREALLAELDLHKIEFSSLRQEYLELIESERQYLNFSLVAMAGGLGLSPFIAQQRVFIVLLLLPFVFHVLLWEMLKAIKSVSRISGYLLRTLIPRVNAILDALGDGNRSGPALGWEIYVSSRQSMTRGELLTAALSPTRHWIPVLAVGVLVITYLVVIQNCGYTPTMPEFSLVFVNLILLIWAAVQNVLIAKSDEHKTQGIVRQ